MLFPWRSSCPYPLWGWALTQSIKEGVDFYLQLVPLPGCNCLFQRWEAVGKNVLLWAAVLEGGIATAAVWRDVDALVDLSTSGCLVFLPREASGIAIILTARFWVASSLPNDIQYWTLPCSFKSKPAGLGSNKVKLFSGGQAAFLHPWPSCLLSVSITTGAQEFHLFHFSDKMVFIKL